MACMTRGILLGWAMIPAQKFDRYGKLLKQLSPVIGSNGWDGTFNGEVLPSTDYWFKVEYKEANTNKEFKAHFSLKR
jgi:gliding motility-associated-like protein